MNKFEKIFTIILICFAVIWGNAKLIHACIVDHFYCVLLYYPIAYLLTCIPGYMFTKDFKYEKWWVKAIGRTALVLLFGGLFIFA